MDINENMGVSKCNNGNYRWNRWMMLFVSNQHVLWVNYFMYHFNGIERKIDENQSRFHHSIQRVEKGKQMMEFMRIVSAKITEMVGERSRKEPVGEVEKWKQITKVWEK